MKKILVLLVLLLTLAGCSTPNSLQLDIYQGYGNEMKLLHLNASDSGKRERIQAFSGIFDRAEPLDKDPSLFAYYPDYRIDIRSGGAAISAVVDINGKYVDFYYPDEESGRLYRSEMSSKEFRDLLNQRS